jgi:mRNA interferase RelE/StbE
MRLEFRQLFLKEVSSIRSSILKEKIEKIIIDCKDVNSPREIKHLKKLKGYSNFYRIEIGSYRIGIQIVNDLIVFSRCLPRKYIYKYFP